MELSNEAKAIFRGRLIERLEKDTRVLLCDVPNAVPKDKNANQNSPRWYGLKWSVEEMDEA